ncbi:MAG: 50S ribosomal protein L17 [Pseudomonadaceae bacterium]|nr:50S ribosomal protein L17 [Pseudomonadaceae bacterium]
MRHGYAGRQLGRDTTARKALFRGLAMQLIEHGQIVTTLPKAKDLRRVVEPMITRARTDNLANRRLLSQDVTTPATLKKLFEEVAPLFKNVQGGYTRVLKMGFRKGDDAPMALIQLTKQPEAKAAAAKPAKAKKAAKAAEAAPAAEEAKAE